MAILTTDQIKEIKLATLEYFDSNNNTTETIHAVLENILHNYLNLGYDFDDEQLAQFYEDLEEAVTEAVYESETLMEEVAPLQAGKTAEEQEAILVAAVDDKVSSLLEHLITFLDGYLTELKDIRRLSLRNRRQ